jgi:hypothetical protein
MRAASLGGYLLANRRNDAKHDRVGIDLRIGPGEIDLVFPLHQRDDPFLLDERGAGVVELYLDPLPHRQRDELDPGFRDIRQSQTRHETAGNRSGAENPLKWQQLAHESSPGNAKAKSVPLVRCGGYRKIRRASRSARFQWPENP